MVKTRANGTGTAYKRGRTWTAKIIVGWRPDGSAVARTKGGFRTKTEALLYCQTLKQAPEAPSRDKTFGQNYELWCKNYTPRITASTMSGYKAAYRYFRDVAYRKITEITVTELQACIDACPRGHSVRNQMRSLCSLVFRFAQAEDLSLRNPAPLLYIGRCKSGTRPAFSAEELERIRQAVGTVPYAEYVYCLCYLGFRPGEMLALKKTAYDAEHQCLVGGSKTAAGKDRVVTISPKILPLILAQMSSPGEFLFPCPDGHRMSDAYFRERCFAPVMSALQITGKVPYSCRHTFANLMKNVRGSDTDKAALMGHADASMTKYYQSADYDSLRAITDRL